MLRAETTAAYEAATSAQSQWPLVEQDMLEAYKVSRKQHSYLHSAFRPMHCSRAYSWPCTARTTRARSWPTPTSRASRSRTLCLSMYAMALQYTDTGCFVCSTVPRAAHALPPARAPP